MCFYRRDLKPFLSASTEHSNKDKAKEREREEREKKKVKDREREKEKKKHKVINEIKRENGAVKQPIKGWWKRADMQTKWFMRAWKFFIYLFIVMSSKCPNNSPKPKKYIYIWKAGTTEYS